jgi:hypothetical protein
MPGSEFVRRGPRALRRRERTEGDEHAVVRRTSASPRVVGHAQDPAEREADRIADGVIARLRTMDARVSAAPGAERQDLQGADPLRRHPDATGSAGSSAGSLSTAERPVVGYAGGPLPGHVASRIESARSGGAPLPGSVRRRMEGAFGSALGDVRVHHDAESATLNRMVSAQAFTTGRDIFFGAGQYRPGTADGEHVLAHELAHTQQGAGVHRSTIRRWNINAPAIDWTKTRKVSTIDSGQPVWFFEDNTGDKLVVKKEAQKIGLSELSAAMHESLSNVKSVKHRKLGAGDKQAIGAFITDPRGASLDRPTWAELGQEARTNERYVASLQQELGDRYDTMDDFALGQYIHSSQWNPGEQLAAMTYASGETAKGAAKRQDRDPSMQRTGGQLQQNRLRALMTDLKHVQALGQLTAVDIFMGNRDRVLYGNLGNWIYDPMSTAMTVIDHVDSSVSGYFNKTSQSKSDMNDLLGRLSKKQLAATATEAINGIAFGAGHFAKDDDFGSWLDSDGGFRRTAAEEAMQRGLEEGRKLLIKTFSATRFRGSRQSRAVKKSIKQAARGAMDIDTDGATTDPDYYYKILKARAEYLSKN